MLLGNEYKKTKQKIKVGFLVKMGCNTSQTPLETQHHHTPFETPSGEGIFPKDGQINEFHLEEENQRLIDRPTTAIQLKHSTVLDRKGDQRVKLPPLDLKLEPLFVRKEIPIDVEIAQEEQFDFEMDEEEGKLKFIIFAV